MIIQNRNGQNGTLFYNVNNSNAQLVDLSLSAMYGTANAKQYNFRFETRTGSTLVSANQTSSGGNGEFQVLNPNTGNFVAGFGEYGIALNQPVASSTILIGGSAATGSITVGSSSFAQTLNLGTGSGSATVNMGTGSGSTLNLASGSFASTVNIGNTTGATAVNIRAGTGGLNQYGSELIRVPSTVTKSSSSTLTTSELLSGYIIYTGNGSTLTLPTASALSNAITGGSAAAGTSFYFTVDVTGASGTCTVSPGTGISAITTPAITGGNTLTVSTANQLALFRIVFTAANTAKLIRIS
jgi:hypothetical protein